MKNWILKKWDWFIYHQSYYSFNRLRKGYGGFLYLREIDLKTWREIDGMPAHLKSASEAFSVAMERHIWGKQDAN